MTVVRRFARRLFRRHDWIVEDLRKWPYDWEVDGE